MLEDVEDWHLQARALHQLLSQSRRCLALQVLVHLEVGVGFLLFLDLNIRTIH